MSEIFNYASLEVSLKANQMPVTAAELQGFLTGLIVGNVAEKDWQTKLFEMTNESEIYPTELLKEVSQNFRQLKKSLMDFSDFNFSLTLPEEDLFARIEALNQWVNHFLLGLGVVQNNLDQETGDIGEALDDLQDIARLSYDEEEDQEELAEALEEIIEYVRTLVMLFYAHFCGANHATPHSQHLH